MAAIDVENGKLGGRPVKWTPEAIQAEADELLEWFGDDEFGAQIWYGDFAAIRGYNRCQFPEWEKTHEGFSNAIKRVRELQEARTYRGALRGQLNPTMAIFGLKNNHGWRDQQTLEHTGDVTVRSFPVEYVDPDSNGDNDNGHGSEGE